MNDVIHRLQFIFPRRCLTEGTAMRALQLLKNLHAQEGHIELLDSTHFDPPFDRLVVRFQLTQIAVEFPEIRIVRHLKSKRPILRFLFDERPRRTCEVNRPNNSNDF